MSDLNHVPSPILLERIGQCQYVAHARTDDAIRTLEEAGFTHQGISAKRWTTKDPIVAQKLAMYVSGGGDKWRIEEDVRIAAESATEFPLLTPLGNRASELVAEIRLAKRYRHEGRYDLVAIYAEKDDDFRSVVKGFGYSWDAYSKRWTRSYKPVRSGPAADRMAELAHALLEAGFLVRIRGEEANAKAVSGDFEPEQTRWIDVVDSETFPLGSRDAYQGWLSVSWLRDDDCYDVARSLPGSKWAKPVVVVPPDRVDAVVDFAEKHDFSVADAVLELQRKRQEELARGIVVRPKPKAKKAAAVRRSRPRPKAASSAGVGIDDSLLDAD